MKMFREIALLIAMAVVMIALPQFALAAHAKTPRSAPPHSIVEFDPPGSVYTVPYSINSGGTIAGYYYDAQFSPHGFIRDAAGNFTVIDAPGAATGQGYGTVLLSINDSGEIVGYFTPASDLGTFHGYLQDSLGNVTIINAPGFSDTQPYSVNNFGEMLGCASRSFECNDSDVVDSGFVRDSSGNFSRFAISGAINIAAIGLNNAGTVAGFYDDALFVTHGFVRTAAGKIAKFDEPDADLRGGFEGTRPWAINDSGIIVGFYQDVNVIIHGFIRNNAGAFTSFDGPGTGTNLTTPVSINATGSVTGYYSGTGPYYAFVRTPLETIKSFSAPGASTQGGYGTFGMSINASSQIAGYYVDDSGAGHGFLFQ
jgi:hypothetical protein